MDRPSTITIAAHAHQWLIMGGFFLPHMEVVHGRNVGSGQTVDIKFSIL